VEFEFISGPEAGRPERLQEFLRLEGSGWKRRAGTAIACAGDRVAFYSALARRLADRNWLAWNVEKFDGTAVAAQFVVRFGSATVLTKSGYDESFARYSPGTLLRKELFSRSFGDPGVDELNSLSDSPSMKAWHTAYASYSDIILSPRRPLTTASSLVEAAELQWRASTYAHEHPRLLKQARKARLMFAGPEKREYYRNLRSL
jgi:hypothetical protein